MITPYTRYFRARTGYHDARRVVLADAVEVCKRGCRRFFDKDYSAHMQHDPAMMSLQEVSPEAKKFPSSIADLLPYNATELAKEKAALADMKAQAEADVPKRLAPKKSISLVAKMPNTHPKKTIDTMLAKTVTAMTGDLSGINDASSRQDMDQCLFSYCSTRTYGDYELFSSAALICARGCALAPQMGGTAAQCEDACDHSNCMITPYTRYFKARTGYHDARRVLLSDAVEVCKRGCRRFFDKDYSAHVQHDPAMLSLQEVDAQKFPRSVADLLPMNATELAKEKAAIADLKQAAEGAQADAPKSKHFSQKKPKKH
jgi:hypothetical protein